MPRDGSGIYTQPLPDVVPATTIASTVYNGFVNDVETDLNQPRPIIAGGTGASSAATARANIKAEASTQVVTNYDTQVWEAGSFYSASGATSAPVVGHAFAGTVYMSDSNNVVLEARDQNDTTTPGHVWVREKKVGVWGAWTLIPGSTSGDYVLKTGDTMTGALGINSANAIFTLNKAASGGGSYIYGNMGGLQRWLMLLGDSTAEAGGNSGSNFVLYRANDAGTLLDAPLSIVRSSGIATFNAPIVANANVQLGGNAAYGIYSDGTILAARTPGTGNVYVQGSGGAVTYATFAPGLATLPTLLSVGRIKTQERIEIALTIAAPVTGALRIGYPGGVAEYGISILPQVDNSNALVFYNAAAAGAGTIATSATTTTYNTSSDGRLKDDLKSFDAGNIIDDTNVYDFAWKSTGERSYGIIAQQAQDVYPSAVTYTKENDWYGIDYSKYVPVLLQELKALRARVAALEASVVA